MPSRSRRRGLQCVCAGRKYSRRGVPGEPEAHRTLAHHASLTVSRNTLPGSGGETGPDYGTHTRRQGLCRRTPALGATLRHEDRRGARIQIRSRQPPFGWRFEQIQQQIPTFTQKLPPHDVLVVADEGELFGEYFPLPHLGCAAGRRHGGSLSDELAPSDRIVGRHSVPKPLQAIGAAQHAADRLSAWMAVRSIGEAATRTQSVERTKLIPYILSPEFELAAFKGRKLTYRAWNGQLRQPIVLATGKMHVTVSPQPGFLHQFTELDTLGVDKPETKCRAYNK